MKKNFIGLMLAGCCVLCTAMTEAAEPGNDYVIVTQKGGQTLGYSPSSGVKILEVGGLKFKDLNRNGELDKYEDWRLPAKERAADLASKLSIDEIAGLMLYSAHQAIPGAGARAATYGGKSLEESGADPSDISDQQRKFLVEDNLRHVLVTSVQSPEVAAKWNNKVQALCESIGFGIPANNSSDPRNGTTANTEYNEGAGGQMSLWPGGGPEEGGRDAHFDYGKYAVYPGNNFENLLRPFTEGAFKLDGGTEMAASVMPYYTISYGQNGGTGSNRGNSYNRYLITDLLREKYGFDGVVCTDWMITGDVSGVSKFEGKCWGAENLSVEQRHYEILKAGVDQFGGNNDKEPVIMAYKMWKDEFGSESARKRFEESAVRLLVNMFRTGLFENPYVDPEESKRTVGNPEYMKAGYEAQLRSIVMLKNSGDVLPLKGRKLKAYVPKRFVKGVADWWGVKTEDRYEYPVSPELIEEYFDLTDKPTEADFALVFIESPNGGTGYSDADVEAGGNGYVPISLQYGPYTATTARAVSLAGGDTFEDFDNRSYKGKTVTASNSSDADMVREARKSIGDKPLVLSVKCYKPCVLAEVEPYADAIVVDFETQAQAVLDIVTGKAEPEGLLPVQFPRDMLTVEAQFEDVPRDMTPYVDNDGNAYDFAFGLNWKGVINDWRVEKYK